MATVAVAIASVAVVMALLIADVTAILIARGQAQTAADAAALAAAPATFLRYEADAPAQLAGELAEANGAELVSCLCPGDASWNRRRVEVVVEVAMSGGLLRVGEIRATAAATFDPTLLGR